MIVKYNYTFDHDRNNDFLKDWLYLGNKKILDVGSDMTSIYEDKPWIEINRFATLDLFDIPNSKLHFKGNISLFSTWQSILSYVDQNGKFDCCYISHTLEDISNPKMVCNILGSIADRGFIAIPSKYAECKRREGLYRGYIHHRWIFNMENNVFKAYPKQNFIEHETHLDKIANNYIKENAELQIFWENEIDLKIVNDDFLGPTIDSVKKYYKDLHID
jgi:hypothetical protein